LNALDVVAFCGSGVDAKYWLDVLEELVKDSNHKPMCMVPLSGCYGAVAVLYLATFLFIK
jgi:hypothetical protein